MKHTTYNVSVVGKLWMPQSDAALELRIDASKFYTYPQVVGESDEEYETRMVQCAAYDELGDFSSVDAWEITREDRESDTEIIHDAPNVRREITSTEVTYTELVTFGDNARERFYACFEQWEEE